MTWLAWRQYRVALFCAVVAIVLYATAVVVLGSGSYSGTWSSLRSMVLGSSSLWPQLIGLIVATFIGAPLIAREREQGTHHFAWTQGIARTRWLSVKLGLLLLGLIVLSIGFALIANKRFEFETNTAANHSMITVLGIRVAGSWRGFFSTSIVSVVLVVFALMLGVAVGCFVRRNIPAMTIAFVLFLCVFLALTNWYTYLIPPQTYTFSQQQAPPQDLLQKAAVIKWVSMDKQGNEIKDPYAYCYSHPATSKEIDMCMASMYEKILYQPEENYWPLQWMASGILLVLSLGLGVVVFLRVRSSVD
ncbi:ABC transporter permease subunit [Ktedonobacter robiniae]|uniref:Transporter n=1 Tax=Ktedonobacter robiniae TaxID=2778365 RepID=A0ABQ3V1X3_9CHLR|nr:ABC transporter permease subunit [Ktedonobacter robiniae]GHO58787.1 transporter [Ktedonobacter robiniae]